MQRRNFGNILDDVCVVGVGRACGCLIPPYLPPITSENRFRVIGYPSLGDETLTITRGIVLPQGRTAREVNVF